MGDLKAQAIVAEGDMFHYPFLTIETKYDKQVIVKWINDLFDELGNYLAHILLVGQILH